jgi:hypothetical protein
VVVVRASVGYSEQDMIDNYLAPMTQLELDYPGVTFVYMTVTRTRRRGGNLHQRNEQIRAYCRAQQGAVRLQRL